MELGSDTPTVIDIVVRYRAYEKSLTQILSRIDIYKLILCVLAPRTSYRAHHQFSKWELSVICDMSFSIPSLVLCGSQTIPPTSETLDQLALYLSRGQNLPELSPLLEAIRALPELWATLKIAEPRVQTLSDAHVLSLRDWLSSSSSPLYSDNSNGSDGHGNNHSRLKIPATLPNVLLAPLTVILHIAQYTQFLDSLSLDFGLDGADVDAHVYIRESLAAARSGQSGVTDIDASSKFQGLCIGALSAAVMECSLTRMELGQNAAVAVRLAMCIGGFVDSTRALATSGSSPNSSSRSETACFIARWDMKSGRENVEEILKGYPEVRYMMLDTTRTCCAKY